MMLRTNAYARCIEDSIKKRQAHLDSLNQRQYPAMLLLAKYNKSLRVIRRSYARNVPCTIIVCLERGEQRTEPRDTEEVDVLVGGHEGEPFAAENLHDVDRRDDEANQNHRLSVPHKQQQGPDRGPKRNQKRLSRAHLAAASKEKRMEQISDCGSEREEAEHHLDFQRRWAKARDHSPPGSEQRVVSLWQGMLHQDVLHCKVQQKHDGPDQHTGDPAETQGGRHLRCAAP